MFFQQPGGGIDLLDGGAFVHSIQDLLGTAFSAHPYVITTGPGQRFYIIILSRRSALACILNLKDSCSFSTRSANTYPAWFKSEDVVAEPDMIKVEFFFQQLELLYYMLGERAL